MKFYQTTCLCLALILMGACSDKKPLRAELNVNKVVADDLFLRFPGTLRVTPKHILLQNPFNKDAFLQVYDRQTGQEVLNVGTIGQGPGEWNSPDISNVVNNKVAIYDVNMKKVLFAESDAFADISNPDAAKKIDMPIMKFAFLTETQWIAAGWNEGYPFQLFCDGNIIPCGRYPMVNENVKNVADCFQGTIQIHTQKKLLVYATFDNPYLALYKVEKNKLNLLWENQFKLPQYAITDGKLHWKADHPGGVSDIAFTKDYIVCLVKDFDGNAQGRDVQAAPKAVYVFNYSGKLMKIFDLPVHSIRLAADTEANQFYSIDVEPEFRIVEYSLPFD